MEKQNLLTDLEKHLYNKHLAVSRSERNKPFKLKNSFTDVEGTDKHKFLKRISILFCKHPEINPDIFFKAPYKLYPDVAYFGLDYFSTMRAVRAYTTYKKTLLLQDPDSQLEEVKDSLKFIANFCIEREFIFINIHYIKQQKLILGCNIISKIKLTFIPLWSFLISFL